MKNPQNPMSPKNVRGFGLNPHKPYAELLPAAASICKVYEVSMSSEECPKT
jgi:hypothetical protein